MIITKIYGTGVTAVQVNEEAYATAMGSGVVSAITPYEYDGADWIDTDTSTTANFTTLGITVTGTPVSSDTIVVAYHKSDMIIFNAGEGISAPDLNTNFDNLKTQSNTNESGIADIDTNALRVDGTNVSDATVAAFNRSVVVTLGTSGSLQLTDNADHFLAPTGNCTLVFPTIDPNENPKISHTINVAVQGSNYIVNHGLSNHLLYDSTVDTTAPYNLLFMYNHSDGNWYYYLTQ